MSKGTKNLSQTKIYSNMKKIQTIQYLAYDGTMFNNEKECRGYERNKFIFLSAELDAMLRKKHYSGFYTNPVPHVEAEEWRWGVCEMTPHVASILIDLTKILDEERNPTNCQQNIERIRKNVGKVIAVRNGIAYEAPYYHGFVTADELIGDIMEYFNLDNKMLNFATTGY